MACRCIWLFLLLLSHKMCLLLDAPVLDNTDQLPELATFKEQHPELAATVDTLPSVMMADRAPATVAKYSNAFHLWTKFVEDAPLATASPVGVACYLLEISATAQSPAPILSALHGVDWAHQKAGLPCPGSQHIPRQTADGLIRQLSRPARKMQPLTMEHLSRLMEHFGGAACPLMDLQMLSRFLQMERPSPVTSAGC